MARPELTALGDAGEAFGPVDLAETKQLYTFLDGAIMSPDVRQHLWKSWGFCPRHTWCHVLVEYELRTGPFSTSILYENLARRAARLMTRPLPASLTLSRLRSRETCFTCDYVAIARVQDHAYDRYQALVNQRRRFHEAVARSEQHWAPYRCQECAGGAGPTCRLHLLEADQADTSRIGHYLEDLANDLAALVRSMTWKGPAATPAQQASWVKALGWFASWRPLLGMDRAEDPWLR